MKSYTFEGMSGIQQLDMRNFFIIGNHIKNFKHVSRGHVIGNLIKYIIYSIRSNFNFSNIYTVLKFESLNISTKI